VETGLKALADVDTASRCVLPRPFLTVKVLGPVLAQGSVSRLTVDNPNC